MVPICYAEQILKVIIEVVPLLRRESGTLRTEDPVLLILSLQVGLDNILSVIHPPPPSVFLVMSFD